MPDRAPVFRPGVVRQRVILVNDRPSAAKRGYGRRWQKARAAYLAAHPLCVECAKGGRAVPSTDVDHVRAVTGPDDPKFWDHSNWQALCHGCHSRKTVREDGGRVHR